MHILFVNHYHLDSNSGIHIFNLANQLTQLGVQCTVCVPDHKETVEALGRYNFGIENFYDLQRNMRPGKVDLIHAWTPRERVRIMTEKLANGFEVPYLVHLEDNEDELLRSSLKMLPAEISDLPSSRLDALVPKHLSHPIHYKQFLEKARGVTMLMDTLQEFCPENIPTQVFWAGYEDEMRWQRPPDEALRQRLNIAPGEYVIAYTGNVHLANLQEVFSLYLAVGLLNRHGLPTRLVRTGIDFIRMYDGPLKMLDQYCVSLEHVPRAELPAILSIADALVQPGKSDAFNIYRFPSKLPEYLASGKPVILPLANIGRFLKDDEEAVLLHQGNALEIAQKLEALLPDQARRDKIGAGGRRFAEANLKWDESTKKLLNFYLCLIDN